MEIRWIHEGIATDRPTGRFFCGGHSVTRLSWPCFWDETTCTVPSAVSDISRLFVSFRPQMTYRTKMHRDDTLSTEQSITLEWMLWREGRIRRDGTAGDASVSAHDDAEMVASGGILGHLDRQGAMECVVALIQKGGGGGAGERARWEGFALVLVCDRHLVIERKKATKS